MKFTTFLLLMFSSLKGIVYGYSLAVFAWVASFIVPIQSFLVFTVFLVFMDMGSGILAAMKRGDRINSKGLGRTITKCISYYMVILSAQGFVNVFEVTDYLTWAMAFLITITEFKSLIENVEEITGTEIWKTISELIPKIKTGK